MLTLPVSGGNVCRVEASFRRQSFPEADQPIPESTHVFNSGLERFTPDDRIWTYAAANGFAIVTADADFLGLSQTRGYPPRVIGLENCNYKPAVVERLLRDNAIRIAELEKSDQAIMIIRNTSRSK